MKAIGGIFTFLFVAASMRAQIPDLPLKKRLEIADKARHRERELVSILSEWRPVAEVYIQMQRPADGGGKAVVRDAYYLGRESFGAAGVEFTEFVFLSDPRLRLRHGGGLPFLARGFAQTALPDNGGLDSRYSWEYRRQEFVEDTRTYVFDVRPNADSDPGRFIGRVYVSVDDYSIIRFNGTYSGGKKSPYFHFDSWRFRLRPGLWAPRTVYLEEEDLERSIAGSSMFAATLNFWGYQPPARYASSEHTTVEVSEGSAVTVGATVPANPRDRFQDDGDEKLVDRLQRAGMVAVPGTLEPALKSIVENILSDNQIAFRDITCHLLLTTPLESFNTSKSIYLSKGLMDSLTDDGALAVVLARELAHVVLGQAGAKYAFTDRTMVDDFELLKSLNVRRSAEETDQADKLAFSLLAKSRYKTRLTAAALFVRAVARSAGRMPNLTTPLLGNRVPGSDSAIPMSRMADLAGAADEFEPAGPAALSLESRVRVDPWTNIVTLGPPPARRQAISASHGEFEIMPVLPVSATTAGASTADDAADMEWVFGSRPNQPAWPARR
jgi:hypothetical protein